MENYQKCTFSIIKGKTLGYKVRVGIFYFSFTCGLVFSTALSISNASRLFGYFGIACIAGFLITGVGSIIFGKFKRDGRITLDGKSINVFETNDEKEVQFSLDRISNLRVTYNDSQRNIRVGIYGIWGGDGVGNFLEFEEQNGTRHRYELLVDDDRKLKSILTYWQKRGIIFKLIDISRKSKN